LGWETPHLTAPQLASEELHAEQTQDHGEETAQDHDPLNRGERVHGAVDDHSQGGESSYGA
jgi:hypothetical protein